MEAPVNPESPSTLNMNININETGMDDELTVTLTRAQLTIIKEFLAENLQPKGYEMISFAYDLFTRLNTALEIEGEVF
jgi:hypothetical protein